MDIVVTVILTLLIVALLIVLFRWLKTPYYRVDKQRMVRVLEMVLTGQARESDWQLTFGMDIRHSPELEAIREVCCQVEEAHFTGSSRPPYLFSEEGLAKLKKILETLKQIPELDHNSH